MTSYFPSFNFVVYNLSYLRVVGDWHMRTALDHGINKVEDVRKIKEDLK